MAIKSISQLEEFDNGTPTSMFSTAGIGKNMVSLPRYLLTKNDVDCVRGSGWPSQTNPTHNTDSYYESLFEISQPSNVGPKTDTTEYSSKKIKYSELIKDIIWDVKAYLNWRNELCDYNLYQIVDGKQDFRGTKILDGSLSISNNLSTTNLSTLSLSARNGNIAALSTSRLSTDFLYVLSTLNANSAMISNVTVGDSFNICCQVINTRNQNTYFNGYAYGLSTAGAGKVSCGTNLSNFGIDSNNNTLSGQPNRTGDPVMFKDGRPYELTCVNYAMSAYNLVNKDSGELWNIGTARMISGNIEWGGTRGWNPQDTVVRFKDGVPVECNVIDFANHALWSDLGEKYLADAEYEPGTLVKFGGAKEITIADTEANAIVSTKAFELNACLKGGTTIALCGRVPTKIKGKIQKFDKIMLSDVPGIACKWDGNSKVIGRALESSNDENIKLVECVTQFQI